MATASDRPVLAISYPKLPRIGDSVVFMHAGERQRDKTYDGNVIRKEDGKARQELVVYGVTHRGGYVVDPGDDEQMVELESMERIAWTFGGTAWWSLNAASKKLDAYGPARKGDRGGSGACLIYVERVAYSKAVKSGSDDYAKLFGRYLDTNPADTAIVDGRLVMTSEEARKAFVRWNDDQPKPAKGQLGNDWRVLVSRPKPEYADLEAAADEFAAERKAFGKDTERHEDEHDADQNDTPEDPF